jgi:hypothetical protein
MNLPPTPTWEHAHSRFQCVTEGLIHQLQSDFFAGRELGKSIPGMDNDTAAVMVAESLEADIVWNHDPDTFMSGAIKNRRRSDFMRAALAEICFIVSDTAKEKKDQESVEKWWAIAMANLQELSATPTASPMLDYEEIFFELSQKSRDFSNQESMDWLKRSLAHNLQYEKGNNACNTLRDIAELHLRAGNLDRGLNTLTVLLHHDPADIWTYNIMAILFDEFGLTDLGTQAIQHGLQLIEEQGDKEELHKQLIDCMVNMQTSKIKGNETKVTPTVLDKFQRALHLDFKAGQPVPIPQLCRELVPDLDQVPVKRPLTSREFPLPNPEEIISKIQNSKNMIPIGKPRRRRKRKHG